MADPCTAAALDVPVDNPAHYDGLTYVGVSRGRSDAALVISGPCRRRCRHLPAACSAAFWCCPDTVTC